MTGPASRTPDTADLRHEILNELGLGVVPNLFSAPVAAPQTLQGVWSAFRDIVLRGALPRPVKEMMGVLVSRASGSPYAAAAHLHALTLQGVQQGIVEAMARGEVPAGLSEQMLALLRFALRPGSVEGLRAAGLSEAEVSEAVAVVGVFRLINTYTDLLHVPIDGA